MKFCGIDIPENYYNGKKVITIHEMAKQRGFEDNSKISSLLQREKKRMEKDIDFFMLDTAECENIKGIPHTYAYAKGMCVATESGYAYLTKVMDRIWKKKETKEEQPEVIETVEEKPQIVEEPILDTGKVTTVTNENFTEMVQLMSKTLDMFGQMVQQQGEYNKEMCKLVTELALARQSNSVVKDDYNLVSSLDFPSWKTQINKAIKQICDVSGRDKNDVLSACYKELTKQYGYVFEDVAKKFYNRFGRSPVNSLENVWYGEQYNPAYRNLMIAKLNTMYKEASKNAEDGQSVS